MLYTAVDTFDRENQIRFEFTTTVGDMGNESIVNQTTIVINIIDINDNYPEFVQPLFLCSHP